MSQANRGMALESLLEHTNASYIAQRRAIVQKIPTPVKIMRTLRAGKVEGFLERASTVDYVGIYRGRALAFEAKSTKEMHRFPLSNFHEHQVEFLRTWESQGGIAFAIVEFVKQDIRFYVPSKLIVTAWDKAKTGAKSITFNELNLTCYECKSKGVAVDYLSVVDLILDKHKEEQQ